MKTPSKRRHRFVEDMDWPYQNLFDHSRDSILLYDLDGYIVRFNRQALDLFGYSAQAMKSLRVIDLYSTELKAHCEASLSSIVLERKIEFETVFRRQDGSIFPAEVTASLFEIDGQKIVQSLIHDITQRKLVETALQQQIEKERLINTIALRIRESLDLQTCLQTTVDEVRGFLHTDRVLIYCFNSDWSGQVPVESVGEDWVSVYQKEIHDPCFGESYAELYRRGQVRVIPDIYQANYRDCHVAFLEQFQIRASLVVPIIQDQALWGLLIAHHCQEPRQWQDLEVDLLRKLATQFAIAVHQTELYAQMQAELAERKRIAQELKDARDEAVAAASAKSNFLATMSHEIRTPMNGVIGMTGLLLDTQLSDDQRQHVTTIRNCGDSLLTIINDILDFSKIESGNLELEESAFDLDTCLAEALTLLSTKAEQKGLAISYSLAPNTPTRWIGDITRLRQILVNLLSNAVKFTASGQVQVTVTVLPLSGEHDHDAGEIAQDQRQMLQFEVADTGIGIPQDKMDRLFKSFSQIDASISRQYGGTGLGLAISKRLCEMMEGRMWVESQMGQGSQFYFTVSLQADPAAQSPSVSLLGQRVLVVEPDARHCEILQQALQSWEMVLHTAQSGYEAIGILACEAPFDVIILAPNLPNMGEFSFAQALHQRKGCETIPIVMMRADGDADGDAQAKAELLSDSANSIIAGWLPQPIQQESLKACLEDVLSPSGKYPTLSRSISSSPISSNPVSSSPTSSSQTVSSLHQLSASLEPTLGSQYPLKVLVAEDNLVNQQLAQQWLKKLGYRAEIVSNGYEVLEALRRQPYDLILMDMQMPEMDGITATEQICQQWPVQARPKIIAVTANAMQGDRERCLEAGMDDYLSKPIRVPELIKVIKAHCTDEPKT